MHYASKSDAFEAAADWKRAFDGPVEVYRADVLDRE